MPTPLVTQHYPDDFQVVNLYNLGTDNIVLFADRDLVIDQISIAVVTKTPATTTGTLTFSIVNDIVNFTVVQQVGVADVRQCASGDIIILGGDNWTGDSSTVQAYKTASAGSTVVTPTTAAAGNTQLQASSNKNILRKGQSLVMDVTYAGGTTTAATGCVQVRFRSRVA